MTSPYTMFKTDADLEAGAGVTFDYGPFSLTLHRAGGANKKYAAALTTKIQPYRRQMQAGTMAEETSNRLMAEVYADTIIIGWKNMKDEAGKAMAFNRENCIKLLLDLPELFAVIQEEASRIANFRKEEIEADAKNSVKS